MRKVDLTKLTADSAAWGAAIARLRAHPEIDYWRQVIARLNASPFWRGEVDGRDGRKPFLGNFDSLVRRDTHRKALEGAYDDHAPNGQGGGKDYDWSKVFGDEVTPP
jgi:hypothetical protein